MFNSIQIILGFLTRIPVKTQIKTLDEVAQRMWLFPFVGVIIGGLAASFGYFLQFIFPSLLIGFLLLGFLLWITGAHHLDGLLDFGDGIMVHGDPAKKIAVMHDTSTGTGGFILGFTVLSITAISLGMLDSYLFIGLFTAEIAAKLAMVFACSLGPSANTPMIQSFVQRGTKGMLLKASLVSLFFLCLVYYCFHIDSFEILGIFTLLGIFVVSSCVPTIVIDNISQKYFAGLTGDCIGALNEITRMWSYLIFIIFIPIGIII